MSKFQFEIRLAIFVVRSTPSSRVVFLSVAWMLCCGHKNYHCAELLYDDFDSGGNNFTRAAVTNARYRTADCTTVQCHFRRFSVHFCVFGLFRFSSHSQCLKIVHIWSTLLVLIALSVFVNCSHLVHVVDTYCSINSCLVLHALIFGD